MLTVGQPFPPFSVRAACGVEDSDITTLTSETFRGQWKVFVFYPKDFSFLCPGELAELGNKLSEFEKRDTMVIAGSTDNEYAHLAWRRQHPDLRTLGYPTIAAQQLAHELGIVTADERVALRATFIVDPMDIIQHVSVFSTTVTRNIDEIIRALDTIQNDELCACNWQKPEELGRAALTK